VAKDATIAVDDPGDPETNGSSAVAIDAAPPTGVATKLNSDTGTVLGGGAKVTLKTRNATEGRTATQDGSERIKSISKRIKSHILF
jgi:opacity protein-like surface antigen